MALVHKTKKEEGKKHKKKHQKTHTHTHKKEATNIQNKFEE